VRTEVDESAAAPSAEPDAAAGDAAGEASAAEGGGEAAPAAEGDADDPELASAATKIAAVRRGQQARRDAAEAGQAGAATSETAAQPGYAAAEAPSAADKIKEDEENLLDDAMEEEEEEEMYGDEEGYGDYEILCWRAQRARRLTCRRSDVQPLPMLNSTLRLTHVMPIRRLPMRATAARAPPAAVSVPLCPCSDVRM